MLDTLNATPQSIGGKIRATQQRREAEQKYLLKPNYCLFCNAIIQLNPHRKVAEIRKKRFCNHKCAKLFYPAKIERKYYHCRICQKSTRKDTICRECINKKVLNSTKEVLFSSRKNWQSARSDIQRTARKIYNLSNRPKECEICKYNLHYEVCHIKPVSEFPNEATIQEINAIENLKALCPNHHWEFDNL